MKNRWTSLLAILGMGILILDSRCTLTGAADGVALCIRTVIPALFPFFVLSVLLTDSLSGQDYRFLRPLGKICRIPPGGETLFLIGLLGGYPTGAAMVAQAYESGSVQRTDARRMLGFCSNAGPSFLFGIAAAQLGGSAYGWILWGIHIAGALCAAMLLPCGGQQEIRAVGGKKRSVTEAMEKSIAIMARVCGWIIFSRVILAFLIRWCLWLLPDYAQVGIMGLLELTIGCTRLSELPFSTAFLLCSALLSLGGGCVLLQTLSVTGSLGLGMYLPGKMIQLAVSILLSCVFLLTKGYSVAPALLIIPGILLAVPVFLMKMNFWVAIREKEMYNDTI